MVHPAKVTASAPTANNLRPSLSRSHRSRASGSFHAGEPFPFPSPYDETRPSGSRTRRRPAADPRSLLRRQSTPKYHTFPTSPPESPSDGQWSPRRPRAWYKRLFRLRGKKSDSRDEEGGLGGASDDAPDLEGAGRGRQTKRGHTADYGYDSPSADTTPLPWAQLSLLALLSLAEQTALNSIGPYLPTMVASFDEIPDGDEGLYVGLLASSFALAQLATNLLWGYLSDRVGRKPTMLLGTSLLMVCFVCFGLCSTFAQLIMVHVAMGLFNGNAAIVPTCLGEITDRTNQSGAFTWLPVIYSLGSITGPALGGLLVGVLGGSRYPFLAPNIVVAALLLASVVVLAIWFDETLNSLDQSAAGLGLEWLYKARDWCAARLRRTSQAPSRPPATERLPPASNDQDRLDGSSDSEEEEEEEEETDSADEQSGLFQSRGTEAENGDNKEPEQTGSAFHELSKRNTLAILGTYLVFQLTNISYNSLYPMFASSPPPTGRELGPGIIGVSLSLAGVATILFQVLVFQRVKSRIGNLGTYRSSLLGMAISMALMPWIDYVDSNPPLGLGTGKLWLYSELGAILVLKNICAVGGLSSVMLLITNSAPSNETLGTLNGIAQTLSAAGRSVGPFLSGGLFTLSTRVRPKGEALAWGLFAGVALLGWLGSFAIHNKGLESADWEDDEDDSDEIDECGDEEQHGY
ncbi:MFS general substrate transporter-like protein [Thermothelomyces thermophilus ATCC 42464]|uniref:MFS general substrate transporter-like protein n=1 Tax=Thermothelomyces thermophilus (strain ATCC 42464 / BCRC 31852 / DSM 1799) TaxID=573729 RepID=G2QMS2_THET4|nr:MFS general substrate transporter-like protein [Thermothelomyces thermophilus ATCC 42464]AEO61252.1 MFS general substrate transporter-like protein [Thermothelomyces thermophilus ATCC 42464]